MIYRLVSWSNYQLYGDIPKIHKASPLLRLIMLSMSKRLINIALDGSAGWVEMHCASSPLDAEIVLGGSQEERTEKVFLIKTSCQFSPKRFH